MKSLSVCFCNTPSTREDVYFSGVGRAFPGGRLAHPDGQNEEENK